MARLTREEQDILRELNELYSTDVEIPVSIDLDFDAVEYDMAMGDSFDGAIQRNLVVDGLSFSERF